MPDKTNDIDHKAQELLSGKYGNVLTPFVQMMEAEIYRREREIT